LSPGWARGPTQALIIPVLTGLLAAAILWSVTGNGLIDLDDARYLSGNPATRTWSAAFTTFHAGNWHPVTWLAHRWLTSRFGLDPFAHHLASLLLHALSAALLAAAVSALTGAARPAFLIAALFAWHPLHVESVAWAAELKDILAGLFWTLTLLTYPA